ncbi:MAG: peptide chain release factor N(5)-glutamine methyltransferase [Candidatus Lustribacter sp.]|jgi:release factor glutamine methyltransferase
MTVAEALRETGRRLDAVGGTGRLDALLLLEHVTGAKRESFIADDARRLTAEQDAAFVQAVERRLRGTPIAYITGTAGFFGRTFAVDERVLVPRPETEHAVEAVLAALRASGKTAGRIADVGTGSGAIAIALAAELPDAWVFGTDISRGAIELARGNAARNNVFQSCTFLHGDLAQPLARFAPFDALVANLPYVPTAAIPAAPDPVACEPLLALDGGADGLMLYRRLIPQLPALLAPDAVVVLEAAPGTIEPLAALVAGAFPHAHVEIGADYAGLPRFLECALGAGGRTP